MSKKTIKAFAHKLLVKTDFVDCNGRPVGYDYTTILERIKKEFPKARTTRRAFRRILDDLDRSVVRLPARRRTRGVLAAEFIRAKLLVRGEGALGLPHEVIRKSAAKKFSDTSADVRSAKRIAKLERDMIRAGYDVPVQRG